MISNKHKKEWLKSSVCCDIIDLNVISLKNFEAYDRLLYGLPNSERRNDGRLRDKWLKRYAHCEQGGWWVSGVDLLDGLFGDDLWGQFKPNLPILSFDRRKKIKYEAPPKQPTGITALKVPIGIWKAISLRYNISLPANIVVTSKGSGRALGFWAWVIKHPEIPLIITEGAKKAGALITANYVAIALPGVFNGYRQPKDEWGSKKGTPHLIPQLKVLAKKGREIVFCFDRDTKPNTVQNVRRAIARTGSLLTLQGAKVSVISWDYPEKGVDDLIAKRGVECFDELYKARISLSQFKLAALTDISKYKPLTVNQRYLEENLVPPEDAQIIGLKSPKNTGKTEWLSRVVERLLFKGKPVLVITHRIQLAKALCARFGIDHIEEVKSSETGGILGYGLCIDSLHPLSQARFNPEDWSEAVIILDEAEQVIWHLLDSQTCQDNRVNIIENFQKLLRTVVASGGQIYLSDADLSAIALDYISSLIGLELKTNAWVVENIYRPKIKRKLISYTGNDPRDLITAMVKAIERGEKVLVHTTGQKAKSKWGSINLESFLQEKFPQLRIIRIDRDSVSEPGHPAVGCMADLDSVLVNYDVVIASPVIETGVSIDLKNHFNSVWAIAQGIQTVDAVCQTVERLRDDVPRYIWINSNAKRNRIGNGSTSVKALLRSQHQITKANILLLQQAAVADFDNLEVNFSPESLLTWTKRACVVNSGKNNYRSSILLKLLSEGYELQQYCERDIENADVIRKEVYQKCKDNYQNYCLQVFNAPNISKSRLEELRNKKAKTETERLSEKKGNINQLYGIEVTPELVEKDDSGWYSKLQLHYFLTIGNKYLALRDSSTLSNFSQQNKAFKPDINKGILSAKVKALQLTKIEQFFDPEAEFSANSLAQWLNNLIKIRFDIKILLGITINPEKDSAIAVAQRFLRKLGLKLEFKFWKGDRCNKQRIYSGCKLNSDQRLTVFDYWHSLNERAISHAV